MKGADLAPVQAADPAQGALSVVYLTPSEVAQLLRVSEKTLSRLAANDATMPRFKLGAGKSATVRYPRERLMRWLEQQTQGMRPMRRQLHPLPKPAPLQEAAGD